MGSNKKFLYWLFLIALGFAYLYWITGSGQRVMLQMTSQQAAVTKSAVTLIVTQIEAGKLVSYSAVIDALNAELPTAVRDGFIKAIDTSDFSTAASQLEEIVAAIQITE